MKPACGCEGRHLCAYHEGRADGEAETVAAVVADLRRVAAALRTSTLYASASACAGIADRYERGDWRTK